MFQSCQVRQVVAEYYAPRGFHWLEPGLLGGAAQPGITGDMRADLAALQRVGTRLLVSLTEEWKPDVALFREYGIDSLFLAIPDRGAPTEEQAEQICAQVDARIREGDAVVFHCRAGKGRTGTLLACQLIWRGMGTDEAIAYIRKRNRNWIESTEQIDFLHRFAGANA